MIEFFMEYIVFRFGIPRILVSDNDTQFVGKRFEETLLELKVQHIKATTPRSVTGETPFRLAYGVDVVIPVEISLTSPRVDVFDPALSLEGLRLHNDLLEETREEARMRMIVQQEKTARYFNKKVKPKDFKVNDLVLRDSTASQPTVSGKFKPAWEDPYRISRLVSAGTYELAHLDEKLIKNAWNGFISKSSISNLISIVTCYLMAANAIPKTNPRCNEGRYETPIEG
ncbi:uncharacterized protein LOC141660912 [Apium graveolens]|uniref:uncharacterized protein LOC141660912 n=1 Tax=Apium graveolens TaxID=4045 RepID=UPI003D7AFDEF